MNVKISLHDLLKYVNGVSGTFIYDTELTECFGLSNPYDSRGMVDESLHPISAIREGLYHLQDKGMIEISQSCFVVPKKECGLRLTITEMGKNALESYEQLPEENRELLELLSKTVA